LLALFEQIAVAAVGTEIPIYIRGTQLDDPVAGVFEEIAIVADEQERKPGRSEQFFQPEDRLHIEVIGRLVHQQQVRLGGQLAGDRQPLFPAPRERAGELIEIDKSGLSERDSRASREFVGIGVGID
jgi:hypothetical protein